MPMLPPVPIVPSGAVPFNGNQSMAGNLLQNLGTPLAPTDSAPKGYVDSAASGLAPKLAVKVATAIALPANTYSNGSSGLGATLTGNGAWPAPEPHRPPGPRSAPHYTLSPRNKVEKSLKTFGTLYTRRTSIYMQPASLNLYKSIVRS